MNIEVKDLFKDKNIVWLIGLGFLILLLLGGVVFGIIQIKALGASQTIEQTTLETGQNRVLYLQQLAADEAKTREIAAEYRRALPKEVEQDLIFSRIQTLSEEYNVHVSAISFQEVQSVDVAQYIPISLTLSGSYRKIMEMLEVFSYENRLILLDKLVINKAEGLVQVAVEASAYFEGNGGKPPEAASANATGDASSSSEESSQ